MEVSKPDFKIQTIIEEGTNIDRLNHQDSSGGGDIRQTL